jgi:hypothetical protein
MQPESKILFVDVYEALAHPGMDRPIDWQAFYQAQLAGEITVRPEGDAAGMLDRAERAGYKVVFLSERPDRYSISLKRWLYDYDLLTVVPPPVITPQYRTQNREWILKPASAEDVSPEVWKASMVAAREAGEVVYIGGSATGRAIEKVSSAVDVYNSLEECERRLFPAFIW